MEDYFQHILHKEQLEGNSVIRYNLTEVIKLPHLFLRPIRVEHADFELGD